MTVIVSSVLTSPNSAIAVAKTLPSHAAKISCTLNDLQMKNSAFWDCVDREEVGSRGHRYAFMLKKEYDFVDLIGSHYKGDIVLGRKIEPTNQKQREIFPAIEPDSRVIAILKRMLDREIFQELRYECKTDENGRTILWVLDKEALEDLFEIIKNIYPHLRSIKILSSEGVAGHLDFVKALLDGYDLLLSNGKEFLHDQIPHFVKTISFMLYENYYEKRSEARAVIRIGYNRIMCVKKLIDDQSPLLTQEQMNLLKAQLPKIEATLGAHVDILWASSTPDDQDITIEELAFFNPETTKFMKVWEEPAYAAFGRRIFGEDVNPSLLNEAWKLMTELEKQHLTI